jgi:hypothetical protein
MLCNALAVAEIRVPCDSPIFLAVLTVHIPFGVACVLAGLVNHTEHTAIDDILLSD